MSKADEERARKKGQAMSAQGRILHPKFLEGAKVGDLRIKERLGRMPIGNDGRLSWWYVAECERVCRGAICGNTLKISQKTLVERGDRAKCAECTERHKLGASEEYRAMPRELDFARMRLVSDEMRTILDAGR